MNRFLLTTIATIILFDPIVETANALVVRDRETCVRVCIIQFNRYGNIYGLGVYRPLFEVWTELPTNALSVGWRTDAQRLP